MAIRVVSERRWTDICVRQSYCTRVSMLCFAVGFLKRLRGRLLTLAYCRAELVMGDDRSLLVFSGCVFLKKPSPQLLLNFLSKWSNTLTIYRNRGRLLPSSRTCVKPFSNFAISADTRSNTISSCNYRKLCT